MFLKITAFPQSYQKYQQMYLSVELSELLIYPNKSDLGESHLG